MPLSSGVRLGPYEILAPLGAGGMGEVYRARDTRLERIVAVKILPAQFSADPIRKQRLERGQDHFQPESSAHLRALRCRPTRWNRLSSDGVRRRGDAGETVGERTDAPGAGAEIGRPDCGSAGQGASLRRGA